MKINYLVIAIVIAIAFLFSPVLAANPNYTNIIPTNGTIITHFNQSYVYASTGYVTPDEFWFVIILGLLFLFASLVLSLYPERSRGVDIAMSAASSTILFYASFMSQAIDYTTGFGATSVLNGSQIDVYLLESHTIYAHNFAGYLMWGLSGFATAFTLYLIVLWIMRYNEYIAAGRP